METLATTGERGLTIDANATTLNGAIDDSTTSVTFTDAVFSDGQTVTIDQEDITLGGDTGSSLTFATCTREANSTTADDHVDGANVKLAGGTELLTFTYDATTPEYLKGISACAEGVQALIMVEDNGTLKDPRMLTANNRNAFWPMYSNQGGASETLKLYVWLWRSEAADGVFHGHFYGA